MPTPEVRARRAKSFSGRVCRAMYAAGTVCAWIALPVAVVTSQGLLGAVVRWLLMSLAASLLQGVAIAVGWVRRDMGSKEQKQQDAAGIAVSGMRTKRDPRDMPPERLFSQIVGSPAISKRAISGQVVSGQVR